MSKLPKLKIQSLYGPEGEADICDLEQAKSRFIYGAETIIVVEGQVVSSYDELVELTEMEKYKDHDFLQVVLMPFIAGG